MEAKEIKAGMTKGQLWSKDEAIVYPDRTYIVTKSEFDAAAYAMAVNSTFGKGYDPSKMEEMYKMLEAIETWRTDNWTDKDKALLTKLLSTAKL